MNKETDKRINDKTAKLLYFVGGALLLFLVYRFGFQTLHDRNGELDTEIEELSTEISAMRIMQADEEAYVEQTDEMKLEVDRIFAEIPAGVRPEDQIMFARSLEQAYGLEISAMGLNGDSLLYTMNEDGTNPEDSGKVLYVSTVTIDCSASYDQIKSCLRGLQAQENKLAVGDVTFSYNEATGKLSGTMTIQMYYLVGSDKEYEPIVIDGVAIGTDNIFSDHSTGGTAGEAAGEDGGTDDGEDDGEDDETDDGEDDGGNTAP